MEFVSLASRAPSVSSRLSHRLRPAGRLTPTFFFRLCFCRLDRAPIRLFVYSKEAIAIGFNFLCRSVAGAAEFSHSELHSEQSYTRVRATALWFKYFRVQQFDTGHVPNTFRKNAGGCRQEYPHVQGTCVRVMSPRSSMIKQNRSNAMCATPGITWISYFCTRNYQ